MASAGEDTEGREYDSIGEMWSKELGDKDGRDQWYAKASEHWLAQEASIDGVLGGYSETNGPDLRESKRFIELLRKTPSPPGDGCVVDCGAGIGRVTKGLLLDCFHKVDLVEPCSKLLETARAELQGPRVERFINSSLQDFAPDAARYDVIWAQWVLLYLPDDDLQRFLQRCKIGLREGGMICVKENVVLGGNWVIDREDNSIMRTDAQYKSIFQRSGLTVARELRQGAWPTDLYPVKMYALKPAADGAGDAAAAIGVPVRGRRAAARPGAAAAASPQSAQAARPGVRKRPAAART